MRISVTIPRDVYEELVERSRCEGRSISNLAALLMAQALQGDKDEP